MIERKIKIPTNRNDVEPIRYVYGTNTVGIKFIFEDLTIQSGTTAKFYALTSNGNRFEQAGTISGDEVYFYPASGFFEEGKNLLQVELVKGSSLTYTFTVRVDCKQCIANEGTYRAAVNTYTYYERTKQVAESIPEDYTTLSGHVENLMTYTDYDAIRANATIRDYSYGGVNWTWSGDVLTVTGSSTSNRSYELVPRMNLPESIRPGKDYFVEYETTNTRIQLQLNFYKADDTSVGIIYVQASRVVRIPAGAEKILVRVYYTASTDLTEPCVVTTRKLHVEPVEVHDKKIWRCWYSTFERNDYWYDRNGVLDTSNPDLKHSQPMHIYGSEYLYFPYINEGSSSTHGVFFDKYGHFVSSFRLGDYTSVTYAEVNDGRIPDLRNLGYAYCPFFRVPVPDNAYYFVWNMFSAAAHPAAKDRVCVANFPVFIPQGFGNAVLYGDEAFLGRKTDKVLVLGASTAMVDAANVNSSVGYNVAYQQFLKPYVEKITSYGVSGGNYASGLDKSIYDLVVGEIDVTGYDTVVLLSSMNYAAAGAFNPEDTELTTIMGGFKGVIDYIQTNNPTARIIVDIAPHRGTYYTSETTRTLTLQHDEAFRTVAREYGFEIIDHTAEGYTAVTLSYLTYDGTHYNKNGGRLTAEHMRPAVCGF